MLAQDPAQVLCVPPCPTGSTRDFLLKAAPSPNKYKNKRRLVLNNNTSLRAPPSPGRRTRSASTNSSVRPRASSVLQSFINWADSPPPSTGSPASLATPSPHVDPKRQGRSFNFLPFSFAPSSAQYPAPVPQSISPRNSSETTLVRPEPIQPLKKKGSYLAFLQADPYHSRTPTSISPFSTPTFIQGYAVSRKPSLASIFQRQPHSFFDHTPAPSPTALSSFASKIKSRARSATTTSLPQIKQAFNCSTSTIASTPSKKFTNPLKNIMSSAHLHLQLSSSHSSSSGDSSSSNATLNNCPTKSSSKSRKAPEKILPFTTDQIARMDLMLGDVRAGKGKAPAAPVSINPEDKVYKLPYVPLNGSAPSGTRSLGRDGEYHPPPVCAAPGTSGREVGRGNALPFKDEGGILWSGQDEIDEYAHLLPEERERRRRAKKIDTVTANGWMHFSPTSAGPESACSLDSEKSPARTGSNASSFEVGYDEPVLAAEQGSMTVGRVMNAPVMMSNTRGGDAFPIPTIVTPPGLSSSSSRLRGGDRRKANTTAAPPANVAVQKGYAIDQAGRVEYFSDAFAPMPISPISTLPSSSIPSPPLSPRSKLHRHSTSLAMGFASFSKQREQAHPSYQAQQDQPSQQRGPGYLKPLATAAGQVYNGIRQASFSSGMPSTPPPMPVTRPSRPPTTDPKELKEKRSMTLGGMFKKFGSTKA
ncbi:hypothetical protein FRB95_001557 [Tulasnella sp. JGI-2019a]|nr:hypothetical protein FRB95_001557 [Tulasnella sp. JGI-2019a]